MSPEPSDDPSTDAYIGIGSNLDDPVAHVKRALRELGEITSTRCVARSSLYQSPPMGPSEQPDYVNAAAALRTRLLPRQLLESLLEIERMHGRSRTVERWGPRTLDLDLLIYGDRRIDEPGLTVPHPGIAARPFVVFPLLEIAPHLWVPDIGLLGALASRLPREGLTIIELSQ